ncbi:MAG TPA: PHP domain-containing protein [Kofleriaceae bacterium]|nr:PHP domain-containing protein [Kofleriaceae bacterium]
MRVELHCHSTASDGSDSPTAVGRRAAEQGLALFSLTDHDTCAGWAAAAAALDGAATMALSGVEISAVEAGRTVHLLAYDASRDGRWAGLVDDLAGQARARRSRMRDMVARLVQRGIAIEWDDVLAEAGADAAVLGRPHLARALVKRGAVTSVSEAFSRYLGDGGPCDVPIARLGVEQAIDLARAAGARISLAHPHTLGPALAADLLRRHRDRGLDAIEAAYGAYGPRERSEWLAMAATFGVTVTAGSDDHGFETGAPAGVELEEPYASRLCEWLGLA